MIERAYRLAPFDLPTIRQEITLLLNNNDTLRIYRSAEERNGSLSDGYLTFTWRTEEPRVLEDHMARLIDLLGLDRWVIDRSVESVDNVIVKAVERLRGGYETTVEDHVAAEKEILRLATRVRDLEAQLARGLDLAASYDAAMTVQDRLTGEAIRLKQENRQLLSDNQAKCAELAEKAHEIRELRAQEPRLLHRLDAQGNRCQALTPAHITRQDELALLDAVLDGKGGSSYTRCARCKRITHANDLFACPDHGRSHITLQDAETQEASGPEAPPSASFDSIAKKEP